MRFEYPTAAATIGILSTKFVEVTFKCTPLHRNLPTGKLQIPIMHLTVHN